MKGPPVEQPPPSLKPAVACIVLIAIAAAGLGVAHVARRQRVISLGYELTEAVTELKRQEEENRRLRLERSVLTSPERIERLAGKAGMIQPEAGQIIVVRPESATLAEAAGGRREHLE